MRLSPFMVGLIAVFADAQCVDGKWDPDYNWIKDCTPENSFDGLLGTGQPQTVYTSETKLTVGSQTRTLSWKLHYFKGNLPGGIARDKLPLVVGLHPWTDGATVPDLLDIQSALMEYEGAWEDVLFLTVALENGNNLNTWWDGSKVNGVPTTWAMDGIVALVKARIGDAATLLASAGASGLASKTVDADRVYLTGTSMGGAGAYHIGIRHPELFAALHAIAGFADYEGGPCGTEAFCTSFTNDFIGTAAQNLQMKGLDGKNYPARSYSNMSWFAGTHDGASWTASLGNGRKYEPPYIMMTHGKVDDAVNISSANRLFAVLRAKKYGFSYNRHAGGHSGENFLRLHGLLGFRKNQSFLAFTNNSTDEAADSEQYNFLDELGWIPSSIKDQTNLYEVKLSGKGTADVTPRRLQAFVVEPLKGYHYWLGEVSGDGTAVSADSSGTLTIPAVAVNGTNTLTIKPDEASSIRRPAKASRGGRLGGLLPFNGSVRFAGKPDGEGNGAILNALGRVLGGEARLTSFGK